MASKTQLALIEYLTRTEVGMFDLDGDNTIRFDGPNMEYLAPGNVPLSNLPLLSGIDYVLMITDGSSLDKNRDPYEGFRLKFDFASPFKLIIGEKNTIDEQGTIALVGTDFHLTTTDGDGNMVPRSFTNDNDPIGTPIVGGGSSASFLTLVNYPGGDNLTNYDMSGGIRLVLNNGNIYYFNPVNPAQNGSDAITPGGNYVLVPSDGSTPVGTTFEGFSISHDGPDYFVNGNPIPFGAGTIEFNASDFTITNTSGSGVPENMALNSFDLSDNNPLGTPITSSTSFLTLVDYSDGNNLINFDMSSGAHIMLDNGNIEYNSLFGPLSENIGLGSNYVLVPSDGSTPVGTTFEGFSISQNGSDYFVNGDPIQFGNGRIEFNAPDFTIVDTSVPGSLENMELRSFNLGDGDFLGTPIGGAPVTLPQVTSPPVGGAPPVTSPPQSPTAPPPQAAIGLKSIALVDYVSGNLVGSFSINLDPAVNPDNVIELNAGGTIRESRSFGASEDLGENTDYVLIPFDGAFSEPAGSDIFTGFRIKNNGHVYLVNDINIKQDGTFSIKYIGDDYYVNDGTNDTVIFPREFTVNNGQPNGIIPGGGPADTVDTGAVTQADGTYVNDQENLETDAADASNYELYDVTISLSDNASLGVGDALDLNSSASMTIKYGALEVFSGTGAVTDVTGNHNVVGTDIANLAQLSPEIWVVFRGKVSEFNLFSGADAPLQSIWFEGIQELLDSDIKIMNMIYNGQNLGHYDINGNPVISDKLPFNYVGSYNVYVKGFYYKAPGSNRIYHIHDANNTYLVDKKEVAITLNGLTANVDGSGVAVANIPFGLNLNLNLQGWVEGFNGSIPQENEINRFFQFLEPQADQYGNIQQYIQDVEFVSLMVVDPEYPKKSGGTEPKVLAQGSRTYDRLTPVPTNEFVFENGTTYDIYILKFVSSRYNLKLPGSADKLQLKLESRSIEAQFTRQLYVMDYGDEPDLSFDDLEIFSSGNGSANYGHFTVKDDSELNAEGAFTNLVFYAKDSSTGAEVGRNGLSEFGILTPGIHQLFADLDGSNKTTSLISVSKKKVKITSPVDPIIPGALLLKDNYNSIGLDLNLSTIISLAKDDSNSTLLTADPALTFTIRYNDKVLTSSDQELTLNGSDTVLTLTTNGIIIIKAQYAGSALYLPAKSSFIITVGKKSVTGLLNGLYIKKRSADPLLNTIDELDIPTLEGQLTVDGFDVSDGLMVNTRDSNGDVTTEGVFAINPLFTYKSTGFGGISSLGSKVTVIKNAAISSVQQEVPFGNSSRIDIKETIDALLHDSSISTATIESVTVRTGENMSLIGGGVKLSLSNSTSSDELVYVSILADNGKTYIVNDATATSITSGETDSGVILDSTNSMDISLIELVKGEVVTVHTSYLTLVTGQYEVDPNLSVNSVERNSISMPNKYDPLDSITDLIVIEEDDDLEFTVHSDVQYGSDVHVSLSFLGSHVTNFEYTPAVDSNGDGIFTYPNVGVSNVPIAIPDTTFSQNVPLTITPYEPWLGNIFTSINLGNVQNIANAISTDVQLAENSNPITFNINDDKTYTVDLNNAAYASSLSGAILNNNPFGGGNGSSQITTNWNSGMFTIRNAAGNDLSNNFNVQNPNDPLITVDIFNAFGTTFINAASPPANTSIQGNMITYLNPNGTQYTPIANRNDIVFTGVVGGNVIMKLDLSNILSFNSSSSNGVMVGIKFNGCSSTPEVPNAIIGSISVQNSNTSNKGSAQNIPPGFNTQQSISKSPQTIELVAYAKASDATVNVLFEGVSSIFGLVFDSIEITQMAIN